MKAEKFEPELHLSQIEEWVKAHDIGFLLSNTLPKNGRIVPDVCALFIYKTDSDVGFIENMISNPKADKSEVSNGFDLCGDELEIDARKLGIKYLVGSSFLPAVADHAKRNGYIVRPESYKLLVKELS